MLIEFKWETGTMAVNADWLIPNMPMANYRQWVKLFAKHGTREQHAAFIELLQKAYQQTTKVSEKLRYRKMWNLLLDRVIL